MKQRVFSILSSGAPARSLTRALASSVLVAGLFFSGTAFGEVAQLTVHEGVVVKFGAGAGIKVHDGLRSAPGVVFTSRADDSIGGQLQPQAGTPAAGDWQGVVLDPAAVPESVGIDGLQLRYAGGGNGAALSFARHAYRLDSLGIADSVVGVRATQGGTALLSGFRLLRNGIALQAESGATPQIGGSEIAQSADYGVQNLTPASFVNARGNWWGDASGPQDATANPSGRGDRVTAGVDYGLFRSTPPLVGCRMQVADGYITHSRNIRLLLTCPHASEYRLSESDTFADASFAPLASPVSFTLSQAAGSKMLYGQFKALNGEMLTVSLRQAMTYAPLGPVVELTAPAENATLSANTVISASATDAAGIMKVDFYVDDQSIGSATQPPYQVLWMLGSYADGAHTVKALATSTQQLSNEARRSVIVSKGGGDFSGPVVTLQFNGGDFVEGASLTQTGVLAITASDASGVQSVRLGFDNGPEIANLGFSGASSGTQTLPLSFDGIAAGAHALYLIARDGKGNESTRRVNFTLALTAPAAPLITSPANGATVSRSPLTLSLNAPIGAQVQVYLDGNPVGSLQGVSASGTLSVDVPLGSEGSHVFSAEARNARGTSPRSNPVQIDYHFAAPDLSFLSPGEGAQLSVSPTLEVSVVDVNGIDRVEFFADGSLLASLTQPPYSVLWDIANVADGNHTLKATASNTLGKRSEVSRAVVVQKIVPPPPLPSTAYTGELSSLAPALSWGAQAVILRGRAVERATGLPVANADLRLRLKVGGFLRNIKLSSDASGAFVYNFIPQENDAGTYLVALTHPDESESAAFVEQGRFTINRVRVNFGSYTLNAARGFPSTLPLTATASAGSGVPGLRWVAIPADQPGGGLPAGIVIDGGSGIDITAGTSAPMSIRFTAGANASDSGTVILTALASDSGTIPRATLRIDYRVSDARPALFTTPTYLETGVQQGQSVNAVLTLGNRGLVAARNVRIKLQDKDGNPPPAWVFLASGQEIGSIDVGAEIAVQITANPGANVEDGIHLLKLLISADNDIGGSVPVSIAVTRSGQGGIRFEFADIYTNTLDKAGKPIPGLAGATLKLQHDSIPSIAHTLISNAQGSVSIEGLAPGVYRYRASAPSHYDAAGRVLVRPGVVQKESVFLDYKLINIEFSVSETTIKDIYQINASATFNAEVPAPVVVLEPLAINLPELQVGEEFSGELTLTNYGLVDAQGVTFTPPPDDAYYRYQFQGKPPATLAAKSRVVIPYKVTSIQTRPRQLSYLSGADSSNPELARLRARIAQSKAGSCSSYSSSANVSCYWVCANGTTSRSSTGSSFGTLSGASCSDPISAGIGAAWSNPSGNGIGGGSVTPPPTPISTCAPQCNGPCCAPGGTSGGNGASGNGSSGSGFGLGGSTPGTPGGSVSQW